MKDYLVQIAINANGEWADRGTLRGRSLKAVLKRAYLANFDGIFERMPRSGNTVFHKTLNIPVLRIVEVAK